MKLKFAFLLMFFSQPLLAKEQRPALKNGQYAIFKNEKYEVVEFKSFKGLDLSLSCFKKDQVSCDALKFGSEKFLMPTGQGEYVGNPSAEYCKAMSGKALVGVSSSGKEDDVCSFSDGSFVKSWSAFYLSYPPKVITK